MPTEPLSPERLDELARRCEAAEAADAELDARIWCALNGKRYAEHWVSVYHKGTQVGFTEPPKRTVIVTKRAVPNVTASIDAAMSLVPEGWGPWRIEWLSGGVRAILQSDEGGDARGTAATPALALCAAAIRARSKETNDGNE